MRHVLAFLAALAVAQFAAAGQSSAAASEAACGFTGRAENALEERLFADAADGRLDEFTPLGAALVAGGVDKADELRRYEQKAKSLAKELRRDLEGDSPIFAETKIGTVPPREQVEAIFSFMHRRVLCGGYDLAATDLRRTLDEGRFNCVSSTVLFNYFAGELGLKCRGLEMPSHAMSRVLLSDRTIDVETTCPRWFHLAGDPRRQAAAASSVIGAAALTDRTKAREVSPTQLAAMIYYNRGVDLLAEKRFAEAAAANTKSLRLDPANATARGNLLATINNWSIQLGDAQHFAEAVDLLRRGLAIEPKFEAFGQNYVHVHHQWVEQLCREGRFDEALAILSRAIAEMPDLAYLRRTEAEVRHRWAGTVTVTPQDGPLLQWPSGKHARPVD
jgi:tetratricopeptide (TPR) repeat protein